MNLTTCGFLISGVFLNALAQLLLKAGTTAVGAIHLTAENWFATGVKLATQLPIIGGLSCYVLSVVVWIIALSRVDVSMAYPMLSLGYIHAAHRRDGRDPDRRGPDGADLNSNTVHHH